ncbi:unnamed protein product [Cuscuta epithymum]|uniref:Transposase-associated domain-containing protein n=1 Tax=Cuscuta epithymum TaxID=186058 RepID=A0AAV0CA74_9ASTE|nr:unnamed protein product [Cuscuta epithymum]
MVYKNREWMQFKKADPRYKIGVKQFLEFAFSQKSMHDMVPCPCMKCNNERRKGRDEIELDLIKHGIVKNYTRWLRHGESIEEWTDHNNNKDASNEFTEHASMSPMLHDAFKMPRENGADDGEANASESRDPTEVANNFYKLMDDLELELYPGCKKFSKLSFSLKLLHIKCLCGISDKGMVMLLELFKDALPEGNTLPDSYYEAQKIIKSLSLKSK